jgi:PadR family transcriptional regulator, regulatory protein PadR
MDARGHLDLLLLATLQRLGEAHGYALIADLRSASDGTFDLAEGTVYPALHRLERGGAVISVTDRTTARPRRIYRLTGAGQALLADQRTEWQVFAEGMRKIVGCLAADGVGPGGSRIDRDAGAARDAQTSPRR